MVQGPFSVLELRECVLEENFAYIATRVNGLLLSWTGTFFVFFGEAHLQYFPQREDAHRVSRRQDRHFELFHAAWRKLCVRQRTLGQECLSEEIMNCACTPIRLESRPSSQFCSISQGGLLRRLSAATLRASFRVDRFIFQEVFQYQGVRGRKVLRFRAD